jgi:ribosomal protein S18 acetylase RimI-like enzyme
VVGRAVSDVDPATNAPIRPLRESDHAALVAVVDGWWDRKIRWALPRLWLQHFTSTSFVAEGPLGGRDDAPLGFVVGFVSQDDPATAYLHLVGVAPGRRRRGIGRALLERFVAATAERGARRATTIAWPGDPIGLAFLRAMGFVADDGPGTRPLYGTPARTDWNRDGDDQVVLDREY